MHAKSPGLMSSVLRAVDIRNGIDVLLRLLQLPCELARCAPVKVASRRLRQQYWLALWLFPSTPQRRLLKDTVGNSPAAAEAVARPALNLHAYIPVTSGPRPEEAGMPP